MQIFVNWLCSCCILLNCFVRVYDLIENVMSIYELFLNVCICIYMHVSLWFLSFSLVHYVYILWWMRVMIMQGELCLIECSKTNPSLREDEHWKCKGILHVSSQCKWSKKKKCTVIEYNKHVMLEEELWMQWLWFYGSIINTACIVIIREMLQFNQ